ncbi:pentatricopeptide repeat-containing protein At1g12620-like isoform X2 [Solanum dulcamara]|uniref:pentatricopeptide repeat-containing protein At1g12620-like isoform X2 n=1 Tax=Solanum dulcamara TaxID=45834 RepID=UPI00248635AC|nr:pentatricopeptide repeat-containing protein At1g12620-like isoform X2 [Solanum dulcamara]
MKRISLGNRNGIISSISVKGKVSVNFECLDDAITLFNQKVRMKPPPSLIDFSKLFNNMISMKHYSAVLSLFREMQKLGIPIVVVVFRLSQENHSRSTKVKGYYERRV